MKSNKSQRGEIFIENYPRLGKSLIEVKYK